MAGAHLPLSRFTCRALGARDSMVKGQANLTSNIERVLVRGVLGATPAGWCGTKASAAEGQHPPALVQGEECCR